MKSISASNLLIYTAVFLFPFQLLAIKFFTGAYDLTSLLLISNIILLSISNFYTNKKTLIALSAFIILQCIIVYVFNIGPYYRFLSGIIWLSALLLIILNGEFLHDYSQKIVFRIIIITLSLSSVYMLYENFFVIEPHTSKRPKAGFSEPSYAGLALLAASSAMISTIIMAKKTYRFIFLSSAILLLLLLASFYAKSMHVVTFAISLSIFIVLWLSFKPSFSKLIFVLFIIFCLLCLGFLLLSFPHYYNRINIFVDPQSMTNPSLLSWLRGLDQAIEVMKNSPFFGYGIGSTGYFNFDSAYGDRLAYYRMYDLTLTDAFSLLWRLLIEVGLIPVILLTIYLMNRIYSFRRFIKNMNNNNENFKYLVFNFSFALALIIGCLIKEPNYARSSLFIGIFLISTISLNFKEKENEQ